MTSKKHTKRKRPVKGAPPTTDEYKYMCVPWDEMHELDRRRELEGKLCSMTYYKTHTTAVEEGTAALVSPTVRDNYAPCGAIDSLPLRVSNDPWGPVVFSGVIVRFANGHEGRIQCFFKEKDSAQGLVCVYDCHKRPGKTRSEPGSQLKKRYARDIAKVLALR